MEYFNIQGVLCDFKYEEITKKKKILKQIKTDY